jgi:hypothetical protein
MNRLRKRVSIDTATALPCTPQLEQAAQELEAIIVNHERSGLGLIGSNNDATRPLLKRPSPGRSQKEREQEIGT